jgi:predicted RNase H-like nuclease
MKLVAGIDGCRGGWATATTLDNLIRPIVVVYPEFEWMFDSDDLWPIADVVAIDIPIGLSDGGSRTADELARELLGPRRSSVFSPPPRPLLEYISRNELRGRDGYRAAREWARCELDFGLSAQTFNIVPKIADVDRFLQETHPDFVFEVHPELCFAAMNGMRPLAHSKRAAEGAAERRSLLKSVLGRNVTWVQLNAAPPGAAPDDALDALAAAWTAARIARGEALRIPVAPERDATGLDMAMWY